MTMVVPMNNNNSMQIQQNQPKQHPQYLQQDTNPHRRGQRRCRNDVSISRTFSFVALYEKEDKASVLTVDWKRSYSYYWLFVFVATAATNCISTSHAFHVTTSTSRSTTTTPPHQNSNNNNNNNNLLHQQYQYHHVSSGVYASTISPHPDNRNKHVAFWMDYLGLTNKAQSYRTSKTGVHQPMSLLEAFLSCNCNVKVPFRSTTSTTEPIFKDIYQQPEWQMQYRTHDVWPLSKDFVTSLPFQPQSSKTTSKATSSIGTFASTLFTPSPSVSTRHRDDGDDSSTSTSSSNNSITNIQEIVSPEEQLYLQRKEQWAAKYTSVDALRKTFGTNRNVLWGDLDPQTTRRLYKTLLPRALLELHCTAVTSCSDRSDDVDDDVTSTTATSTASTATTSTVSQQPLLMLHPEDLAPLAYQARVAAKLYARERCVLPARIVANLYDGFRQWKKYGQFHCHGMSYQQLWDKYASVILHDAHTNRDDLTVEDVTAKICLKILERSCQTNPAVDQLVNCPQDDYCSSTMSAVPTPSTSTLSTDDSDDDDVVDDLKFITAQLEADARSLLRPFHQQEDQYHDDEADNVYYQMLMPMPHKKNSILVSTGTGKDNSITTSNEFHQRKVRLLRSVLRLKRKFERFQCRQLQQRQNHERNNGVSSSSSSS
jgi:hypothetical protein